MHVLYPSTNAWLDTDVSYIIPICYFYVFCTIIYCEIFVCTLYIGMSISLDLLLNIGQQNIYTTTLHMRQACIMEKLKSGT